MERCRQRESNAIIVVTIQIAGTEVSHHERKGAAIAALSADREEIFLYPKTDSQIARTNIPKNQLKPNRTPNPVATPFPPRKLKKIG
ncbi:protein of unknown function [Candidatus Nitrosacidococcus tergens]|uniref:Uncharacterized protein n=1 Tax=Candidatus Nitrosacidococcus tergens TaxID=553981 RepID=A0A7G1Q6Z5_9GAMM|nr:protein of unknown function [Candidatus Nitrosacidococcus tergens]